MNNLKYIIIFIIIGIVMIGCVYKPVDIAIKYQSLNIKNSFEFNIVKSKITVDKVYFTLSIKNLSNRKRVLFIHSGPLTLQSNDSNVYPVYLDELLGDKKSLEPCLYPNEKLELKFSSPISFLDKQEKYYLYIKDYITSDIPICPKEYLNKFKYIKSIKVRTVSRNADKTLDYIGYFFKCKNSKEFYFEFSNDNWVKINDMQKRKQVAKFKRKELNTYLNQICKIN